MSEERPVSVGSFEVSIEGMKAKQFSGVQGLGMATEALPVQEGAMHLKVTKKGRTRYRNISLTRAFTGDKELVKWFQDCAKGKVVKLAGSVIIKDDASKELMRFNFRNAWPVAWDGPDFFVQGGNNVAFETVVLDVEELELA